MQIEDFGLRREWEAGWVGTYLEDTRDEAEKCRCQIACELPGVLIRKV